jgi:hypothetical protein
MAGELIGRREELLAFDGFLPLSHRQTNMRVSYLIVSLRWLSSGACLTIVIL